MDGMTEFAELLGLTLSKVEYQPEEQELTFHTSCGRKLRMYHEQDCCEMVELVETIGDLNDLVGSPILLAREACSADAHPSTAEFLFPHIEGSEGESGTWTFYLLSTIKGSVTLRWLGTSNGYYSERMSCEWAAS